MVHTLVSEELRSVTFRASTVTSVPAFLTSCGLSKREATRVLGEKRLTSEGVTLKAQDTIGEGACVRLALSSVPVVAPKASAQPADVIYRDRFVLAAVKGQGLLVHGDGTGAHTLTDDVVAHLANEARDGGEDMMPSPQALNRLDVDTSGIVLFSLTHEFQATFDAMIAGHEMEKCYLAIVSGRMRETSVFEISAPIGRDRHNAQRMICSRTGKEATTLVLPLAQRKNETLVAVRILTGRRHQIRVHLAHVGHPIVGDALYGRGAGSLMLHAAHLAFDHPLKRDRIVLSAASPARFREHFSPVNVDWSILTSGM